ncbi:molybdenum cofactor biosynthesis protein MoaF [Micromonospora sp. KC606]|uniref:MoaF C-terminal domain-containing protein n=1 Tax=Micromonospora sp. KC606 TaxID=2530379 RepID=UPI001043ADC2|nr:MoaF C-terminal domain-containing protein [Micromonospora sp. KC606]TDC83806.1 molybdenum cofactor biosynthesis protein MoaF [Micromonospora sp. KC606]
MTHTEQVSVSDRTKDANQDHWKTYDDFAAGIDTYRMPGADLSGRRIAFTFDCATRLSLDFVDGDSVRWTSAELLSATDGSLDPYDAVRVRDDVIFLNIPLTTRTEDAVTVFWSDTTGRALLVHSVIGDPTPGVPHVRQSFSAGEVEGVVVTGAKPGPTRDLVGFREVVRYSPSHLYDHVFLSTERYCWQCLQGEQRGHGDVDMATTWKFDETGLYLFTFREFVIPVASVWLHDLGYALRTTGVFIGVGADGKADHRRAGGHIYPLGTIKYPDVQPV